MIIIECSLKDLQNFRIQSSHLYTSGLFFMFLNEGIVDIEKHDGRCSPAFVVNEFSRLFLHQFFLLTIQDLHK